jgi:ABC-type sugar transport system ATPase subunit
MWAFAPSTTIVSQLFHMDEPLSNLDAKLRMQMRAEVAELRDRLGVTTH